MQLCARLLFLAHLVDGMCRRGERERLRPRHDQRAACLHENPGAWPGHIAGRSVSAQAPASNTSRDESRQLSAAVPVAAAARFPLLGLVLSIMRLHACAGLRRIDVTEFARLQNRLLHEYTGGRRPMRTASACVKRGYEGGRPCALQVGGLYFSAGRSVFYFVILRFYDFTILSSCPYFIYLFPLCLFSPGCSFPFPPSSGPMLRVLSSFVIRPQIAVHPQQAWLQRALCRIPIATTVCRRAHLSLVCTSLDSLVAFAVNAPPCVCLCLPRRIH